MYGLNQRLCYWGSKVKIWYLWELNILRTNKCILKNLYTKPKEKHEYESMWLLVQVCKVAVGLSKLNKRRHKEQEFLPLNPSCLFSDYCVNRAEVLSQVTLSACVNTQDRGG